MKIKLSLYMNMRKNKRSNVQLGESIVIIMLVIVMLFIGINFWQKQEMRDVEQKRARFLDEEALNLVNIIFSMPEFQCSSGAVEDVSCIDKQKLDAFISMKGSNQLNALFYREIFPLTDIDLLVLYPYFSESEPLRPSLELSIHDSGLDESESDGWDEFFMPVSYYDAETGTSSFAVLKIKKYR